MTVKDLKELLDKLPDDATVYRVGAEYNGDYRSVTKVEHNPDPGFDKPGNSIFIR